MRFALVGPAFPLRGGIARYVVQLRRELLEHGHSVGLFSFRRQYPLWLYPGRSDTDITAGSLPDCAYTLDSLNPLSWSRTVGLIRAYQPDAVIFQWWVPFFAPMLAYLAGRTHGLGARVLFVCHNVLPHEFKPWDRFLAGLALRRGDGYVVGSASEQELLTSLVGPKPAAISPHPIAAPLSFEMCSQPEARQMLGLPPDVPVLLFFGFVRPYKGLHVLLTAFRQVRDRYPGAVLVVAGEIWKGKDEYLELISRLGVGSHVRLVDRYIPESDVAPYFLAANVAVLPFISATQSGATQLALGFELPVISTNTGAIPQEVLDGETGLIVPPGDADALAHAILRYLDDGLERTMRANIGSGARVTGWSRLVSDLEKLAA